MSEGVRKRIGDSPLLTLIMSSTSLVTEIKKILSEATPSLNSPQHTLDLIATAVHTAEASTTVVPAPHEVAILKLELRNTKEKINEYQLKMKQMVSVVYCMSCDEMTCSDR
mgnify:CR=1 FL=1